MPSSVGRLICDPDEFNQDVGGVCKFNIGESCWGYSPADTTQCVSPSFCQPQVFENKDAPGLCCIDYGEPCNPTSAFLLNGCCDGMTCKPDGIGGGPCPGPLCSSVCR